MKRFASQVVLPFVVGFCLIAVCCGLSGAEAQQSYPATAVVTFLDATNVVQTYQRHFDASSEADAFAVRTVQSGFAIPGGVVTKHYPAYRVLSVEVTLTSNP